MLSRQCALECTKSVIYMKSAVINWIFRKYNCEFYRNPMWGKWIWIFHMNSFCSFKSLQCILYVVFCKSCLKWLCSKVLIYICSDAGGSSFSWISRHLDSWSRPRYIQAFQYNQWLTVHQVSSALPEGSVVRSDPHQKLHSGVKEASRTGRRIVVLVERDSGHPPTQQLASPPSPLIN